MSAQDSFAYSVAVARARTRLRVTALNGAEYVVPPGRAFVASTSIAAVAWRSELIEPAEPGPDAEREIVALRIGGAAAALDAWRRHGLRQFFTSGNAFATRIESAPEPKPEEATTIRVREPRATAAAPQVPESFR
jgi:hypothetical protein